MSVEKLLEDWQLNPGASEAIIVNIISGLSISLPIDYIEFLQRYDGGEGFIGDHYLILWRAEELKVFNEEYEVEEYAPGLFLFGSDGGGEAYGFDVRESSMPVIRVPFVGMDLKYAKVVASSFTDLLKRLAS